MPAPDADGAHGVGSGAGRARALGPDVTALAGPDAHVLIVTDARLAELGLADGVRAGIEADGHSTTVFSRIAGEPKESAVEAAIETARSASVVVALGGGSALDAGKVMAQGVPLPFILVLIVVYLRRMKRERGQSGPEAA